MWAAGRGGGCYHRSIAGPEAHDSSDSTPRVSVNCSWAVVCVSHLVAGRSASVEPLHSRLVTIPQDRLRNFSIIAHIDHGKSTLADRLLELTHTIDARQMTSQVLDSMDLEREKGITIKARAVRLEYTAKDGLIYGLNLIDTPGHVDFAYEVSHSLQACEGAILVVDATQGIEAQTLANVHLAMRENLTLIPVLNKIDLPSADPETIMDELENVLAIPREEVHPRQSAKDGTGRRRDPRGDRRRASRRRRATRGAAPGPDLRQPLRRLQGRDRLRPARAGHAHGQRPDPADGQRRRSPSRSSSASSGRSSSPVKQLSPARSATSRPASRTSARRRSATRSPPQARPATEPLPGYQEAKSLVFAGIYPVSGEDYPLLREALEKLHLNDASFTFEPESSVALGFGFRCGFLGLLHMEIVQERLEREFDLDLIASAPSVEYHVQLEHGRGTVVVDNPALLPSPTDIETIEEPWVKLSIVTPSQYIGALMELSTNRRGTFVNMEYLDPTRVVLHFEMPLAELIVDFYDQLKSRTQGYASMDYEELGYRPANLVKVDILVNGEPVDALSHHRPPRSRPVRPGAPLAERLKQLIPRQMFEIPIQAAIGSNVIARETVRAMRKNVLAKCYGGDITRKRKLLEKQKEGKQRMKRVGSVEIPQEAFLAMLRMDEG